MDKIDFSDINVLVIGDFMLDKYSYGKSNRMSPEFPVPVVLQNKITYFAGGAGNVVQNLLRLNANVSCMGIIGNDFEGNILLKILNEKGANIKNLKFYPDNITTLKHRIISGGQQLLRIDSEKENKSINKKIFSNFLEKEIDKFDIIILSDYNKGVIEKPYFNYKNHNVIIDPKKSDFCFYKDANIITPNIYELQETTKIQLKSKKLIIDCCKKIIKNYNINHVVVKRGSKGMIVVSKDGNISEIAGHFVESPDVTGAGDTVIAVLSLAMYQTKDIKLSAKIANLAASMVVEKTATSTISPDEINSKLEKII